MRKTGGAGFFVESALQDLLRYADKYHEPVSNLNLAILGVVNLYIVIMCIVLIKGGTPILRVVLYTSLC